MVSNAVTSIVRNNSEIRLISECYISSTSGLDVMIGAPLSENYRIARSESVGLASLDGLEAFLLRDGWKVMVRGFSKDSKFSKLLTDSKDAPVRGLQICALD